MLRVAREKKYQIFISSTYEDLKAERLVVSQAVLDMGHIPVGMEQFPASDMSQMDYIKKMLATCDYYILILAGRYGSIDPTDNKGYTEKEYDYAINCGIPVMSFIIEDIDKLSQGKCEQTDAGRTALEKFRNKVSANKMIKKYSSIDGLKAEVVMSLQRCIIDFPAVGWIRGDAVDRLIASDSIDVLNLQNVAGYTDSQILDLMYKANDATRRAWCIELISTNKAHELIEECISIMRNNAEKCKLMEQLAARGYADTDFFQSLFCSLDNSKYQFDALKLCIATKQPEDIIVKCFLMIENNKYIYQALITIYDHDTVLFQKLYRNGKCFSNDIYVKRMQEWLEQQSNEETLKEKLANSFPKPLTYGIDKR